MVRARLRDIRDMRLRTRGVSVTFRDLDLVPVNERVLTVAPTPNSGRTVRMNATNKLATAKRFLEITDLVPHPRFGISDLMHEACQVCTNPGERL